MAARAEIVCGFADPCGTSFCVQINHQGNCQMVMFEAGDRYKSREMAVAVGQWLNGHDFESPFKLASAWIENEQSLTINFVDGGSCLVSLLPTDLRDGLMGVLPRDPRFSLSGGI